MKSLTLTVISGPLSGTKATILADQSLRVGRCPSSDLAVMDPIMSREHFELTSRDSRCWLRDLRSRNGTKLNGEEIVQPIAVRDGDVITAGCTNFRVRLDGLSPEPSQPPHRHDAQNTADLASRTTWEQPST
jgi:pSer/pThr/pTyr-binding forkhead associated (FHA) protein